MSDQTLKDGSGTGNLAKVDSDHRLRTRAETTTVSSHVSSRFGTAYSLPFMDYPIGTPDNEYLIGWFQNLDTQRTFRINRYYMSWNGGNTNFVRSLSVRLYVGTLEPSANAVEFSPPNLNLTKSSQLALAKAYAWTGAGNGMTTAHMGVKGQSTYIAPGASQFDIDGTLIIGFNQIIGFAVKPPEAGLVSLIISGWYAAEEN
jgi:hypothetical protein